jgi:hypothetical protein
MVVKRIYGIPAPVAPEQGTPLSIIATDRSESMRNCRATVKPMMPAPTITTSKTLSSLSEEKDDRAIILFLVAGNLYLYEREDLFLVSDEE